MIASREATERKVSAARAAGVPAGAGGGPYEIAVAQGRLPEYLELCAQVGFDSIECAAGFTDPGVDPARTVELADSHGLRVDYELGDKHGGRFDEAAISRLLEEGRRWLGAGASRLIVEARESASQIGLFGPDGELDVALAERFAQAFGLEVVVFEAPTKASQFALLAHFGPQVRLSNVPLDELLRVEIYRRGLHSDAFANPRLRPAGGPSRGHQG
jgi:phosphosulfolactate synthase